MLRLLTITSCLCILVTHCWPSEKVIRKAEEDASGSDVLMNFKTDSHSRFETGTPGKKVSGYYTWHDGDQLFRVDYTADENGYKPVVSSQTYVAEDAAPSVTSESKVEQPLSAPAPNFMATTTNKPESKNKPLAIDAVKLLQKKPVSADPAHFKNDGEEDSYEGIVVEATRDKSIESLVRKDPKTDYHEYVSLVGDMASIVKEERQINYYNSLHGVIKRTAKNKNPKMETYLKDLLQYEVTEIGTQLKKKIQDELDPVKHLVGHLSLHGNQMQSRSDEDDIESLTDDELNEEELKLWKSLPLILPREALILSPKEKFLERLLQFEKEQEHLIEQENNFQRSDMHPVETEVYIRKLLQIPEPAPVENKQKENTDIPYEPAGISKIAPQEEEVVEALAAHGLAVDIHEDPYGLEHSQSKDDDDLHDGLLRAAYSPSNPKSKEEQIVRYLLTDNSDTTKNHQELMSKNLDVQPFLAPQFSSYQQHPLSYKNYGIKPIYGFNKYSLGSLPQYDYMPYPAWAYPSYYPYYPMMDYEDDDYMSPEEWEYHRLISEQREKQKQRASIQSKPSRM